MTQEKIRMYLAVSTLLCILFGIACLCISVCLSSNSTNYFAKTIVNERTPKRCSTRHPTRARVPSLKEQSQNDLNKTNQTGRKSFV